MLLVDARAYSDQAQVMRCDIKPGSVARSRKWSISEHIGRIFLHPIFQMPPSFIDN